jgi:hypothetical protein
MKFLTKKATSLVLQTNLVYQTNADHNKRIKEILLAEQCNFCAYTEKYIEGLDSSDLEHYNSTLKYNDNYYNYYATLHSSNLYKKDEDYLNHPILTDLFFQDSVQFNSRIRYVSNGGYEEVDSNDQRAIDLIDFLGFNHPTLYEHRAKHISRLRTNFSDGGYSNARIINYFKTHPQDLSFITAIEVEFGIDLSEFYS